MAFQKGSIPWNTGKKMPKKFGKMISLRIRDKNHPMYGKKHTTEAKIKMSEAKKGKNPWNKGKKGWGHSGSFKKGHPTYGGFETRFKRGVKHTEEWKQKQSVFMRLHPNSGQFKKKDPRFKNLTLQERRIKNYLKSKYRRPTSLEKQFIVFIKQHNLPYKYVGNGSVLIGYKNPDFVNTNGEKICVEVANRYHHQGDWKEKRIKHFKKWGWKCLVFFADQVAQTKWKFEKSDKEILKEVKS